MRSWLCDREVTRSRRESGEHLTTWKPCLSAGTFVALLLAFAFGCAHTSPTPLPPILPPPPAPVVEPPAISIDAARALYNAGSLPQYERSLVALSASTDPVVARRAMALLGLFDVEQKRWDAAFDALTKAAGEDPAVAPFLELRLIEVERNRNNLRNAAAIAAQINATAPDSSAATLARLRLPSLYAQLGDTTSTDAAFAQAIATPIDELSEGELVDLAADLDKASRRDLATQIRMHLLTDYPEGRFTEKTYGQLASAPDSSLDALSFDQSLSLAEHLVRYDRYDQAFDLLARIARRFPADEKSAGYRNLHLRALFGSRRYAEVLDETAGIRLDARPMLLRARAAWRAGQPELFLRGLTEIEHEFPSSGEALEAKILRAKYYSTDEIDYGKSVGNLRQAIDEGDLGKEGENLWSLGWTHTLWGHYADALGTFDEYVKRFPDGDYTSNSLFWSGKILEKSGRHEEGVARFRQLIAKYPHSYFGYRAEEILAGGDQRMMAGDPSLRSAAAAAPPAQNDNHRPAAAAAPPAQNDTPVFPDIEAQLAAVADPRLDTVKELEAIDLPRDASREMKQLAAAFPDNLGLQFMLADVYVRGGEPFKANGILQKRFREFVRHGGRNIPQRFWEILFPLNYWPAISAEAQKRGIDPYLIASIIRQESGFEPLTVSNAGAVGLMQIMPVEGQSIAARAGIEPVTRASLFHPMVNIAIGVAEFSQKLADLHGNPILAVAAYNAGEDAVGKWLAHTPIDDIDLFVESIPYAETRLYVKTVMRNRFEYRRIYESNMSAAPSQ
jgi:soluble lytic murein transglycosylase